MQGKKLYSEQLFKSFQLSQRVPEDNFYRRLKDLFNLQWLYKETKKYYGSEGQQSIDPVVFFKLMLIGYLENLGSDRRIISTVSMRLDMLFFIGYDIDEPLPWHSTLSRTRQLYGEDIFKDLFRKVLSLCIDKGMVAGKRQAMDSVFVQANASMESLQRKEVLKDVDNYTDELNDEEKILPDTDLQNDEATKQDLLSVVSLGKEPVCNDNKWSKSLSNHTLQSTTDKDARVSVKPGKTRRLNYLAQVSVDTANHVITQIQSDFADKKDSQCLPSLVHNTIDNLSEHGLQVTIDKELFEKMHNRLQTPMAKKIKKLRSSTVEPVLGTLVNFLGMRRVNTKGVSLAGKCMMMVAIAYNLKKIMKWQSKKVHTEIKELRYSLQSLIFFLTGIIKRYYLITDWSLKI